MSGQQLFTVRKAETPDDFSKVIALFQAYFTWRNVNLSLQDFAASSDIFTRYPPLLSVLLLADDMATGASVGCVAVSAMGQGQPHCCALERLYVRTSHRGRDLGKTLVGTAIVEARNLGYRTMRIETKHRTISAERLFVSLGFVEIETLKDVTTSNTVVLERNLD